MYVSSGFTHCIKPMSTDKKITHHTHSPEETWSLGSQLATTLMPGDIVYLYGELGSGKTVFVKGMCVELGVEEEATSPSFVIATEYEGRMRISHVDLYRLDSAATLALPVEEYFISDGITVIEWAERLGYNDKTGVTVRISIMKDNSREIVIEDNRH